MKENRGKCHRIFVAVNQQTASGCRRWDRGIELRSNVGGTPVQP